MWGSSNSPTHLRSPRTSHLAGIPDRQQQRQQQHLQAQIMCQGCRSLLMYPQGAEHVRCARCSFISPAAGTSSADMAQISCSNPSCRCQLAYPRGARHVQCSLCNTLNDAYQANQLGHVVCSGCSITLMYAYGASSVKCAVCEVVTPIGGGGSGESSHHRRAQRTSLSPNQSHNNDVEKDDDIAVIVENPGRDFGLGTKK